MPSADPVSPSSTQISTKTPHTSGTSKPAQTPSNGTTAPKTSQAQPIPPASTSLTSLLEDLNTTPLFMTHDDPSNPGLSALRALAYEGTPSEVASNFRNQGNECVTERRWGDARVFYTRGLEWLAGKGREPGEEGQEGEVDWLGSAEGDSEGRVVDVEAEEAAQKRETELGYVNRAHVNIQLKNYGHACRDCAAALCLNSRNKKALYRSALALFSLDKLDAARNAIAATLAVDAENANKAALELRGRIEARAVEAGKREKERVEQENRRVLEGRTLKRAVDERKWVVRGAPPADMQDALLKLSNPTDKDSELSVPVLLVYPTAGQTELVKSVGESDSLGLHLAEALPVPWDPEGVEFGGSDGAKVQLFVERVDSGLSQLGKKVALGRVLREGKAVVQSGLVKVFVVPKGAVEGWVEEEKRRRGKGR